MIVQKGIRIKLPGRSTYHLNLSRTVLTLTMMLLALFMLLPIAYTFSTAFKPLDELIRFPPLFFVKRPTMNNFSDLFFVLDSSDVPFLRYLYNSVLVTLVTTAGSIFVATLGGYALSKLKLPFKNALFTLVVIAMTFPPSVSTIPVYMIVNNLNIYNTYAAMIIPKLAGAYGLFLIKQFCDQFPAAILEAARVDGAGEFRIWSQIVLPFLRPAWGTLLVFAFTACWMDESSSIIYTSNQNLRLLPVMLTSISDSGNLAMLNTVSENGSLARAGAAAAAALLIMLPSIVVFILQQRKVMETMAHSGIK